MNPSGMYVAAHTSFALANFKLKSANLPRQEWSNFNLIGLFRIQALASDDFGIDFFMGAGYKRNLVVDYDFMGRKNPVNVNQAYGNYYGSSFKFSIGFNLVFGLF